MTTDSVPFPDSGAFQRGPVQTFEVVWNNGHTEMIQAHQVSYSGGGFLLDEGPEHIQFHGEFDGHWTLVLRVKADDLRSVRNLSRTEQGA